jgi:hypothetical protein
MRLRGAQRAVASLAMAIMLAGCGGGGFLGMGKSAADSDPGLVSKPLGPGLVDRCPVPVAYDDATENKIQAALDALPKDNVLHKAMSDYETERDNLRMCH